MTRLVPNSIGDTMVSTAVEKSRKRNVLHGPQRRAVWGLVTPFLLAFLALFVSPLVYSAYLSLFRSELVGGISFAGLENYTRVLTDPNFWFGFGRVALILLIQVPLALGVAILLALIFDTNRVRGGKFARLSIFLPYAVPSVIATLMWGYIYGSNYGLVTQILKFLGLGPVDLLSSSNILGSIMNILSWEFIGYNMIILYSALRAVPTDLYDAAEIDGAGQWRIAWSIKLPAIRPAIVLTIMFSIIGSFQVFNEPNLLSLLAPSAIGSNFTPNLYAYNSAFKNQDVNYAAAIAFLLGLITVIVSFAFQTAANRRASRS
ncbi:carbohydrate ABC transporter permease [Diaminobutyricibacter sp. McL0608]|uniref:carbohydrate ABC transporter permease n=1 Tax=Leifsonia sp. McL0608 TaxID=3143537 RepID=UPI0031F322A7